MQRNFMFLSLASVVTFASFSYGAAVFAQTPEPASGVEIAQAPGVTPPAPAPPDFNNGLKAMDEGRWSDALSSFDKVHGEYADAALYWKAYNLEKLGRKDLCPCGSGKRFQELLPEERAVRRLCPELLPERLNGQRPSTPPVTKIGADEAGLVPNPVSRSRSTLHRCSPKG